MVAEDQAILRSAIVSCLSSFNEFNVVAQATNGKELIEHLKKRTPDVILMDLQMPVMDGWEALDIIKLRFTGSKVLILSAQDELAVMINAREKGAKGFISKNATIEDIKRGILEVHSNRLCFDKKVNDAIKNGYQPAKNNNLFSERETQVMKEVCNGLSNNLISEKLYISTSTVDFHKQNIYKKTKSKNVIDLLRFAIKNKMFSFE